MKSMLYVGATLMIGASIYGFVDYKQTSQKKEFTNMYDHKIPAPVIEEEKTEPVAEKKEMPAVVKKTNTVAKKKGVAKNVIKEDVVSAIKPIPEEEKINDKELKTIERTTVDVKASKEPAVKKAKKKKLNHKIFSRAPLREEDDVVIEPVKKEEKKTAKNEL